MGYLTIAEPVDVEEVITRSRFIGSLRSVASTEDIKNAQSEIALLYPKANHYCWAYRLNMNPILEHSSDAGEPSGTAGRPLLGALKRESLVDVLVVVTRYFGGVKLGVKGLIDAYGGIALRVVESAKIIEREPMLILSFASDYHFYNILLHWANKNGLQITDANFGDNVTGSIEMAVALFEKESQFLEEHAAQKTSFHFSILEE